MRKAFATALTVAVLGTSALAATSSASQAGHYGYRYHGPVYSHGYYKPAHGYYYGYRKCWYKKVKVWGHYGYRWKKIKVCR